MDRTYAETTPRCECCLVVDEVCLESMDHPGVNSPVVKLFWKDFSPIEAVPQEQVACHEDYEEYEADEGWMYMPLAEYLDTYTSFIVRDDWYDSYIRPPYTDWCQEESHRIGRWRDKDICRRHGDIKDQSKNS